MFGVILSLIFNPFHSSLSTLVISEKRTQIILPRGNKLLRGSKLSGEFNAKENNLGIVYIKFSNVPRVDLSKEDSLIFRIKEKGQKHWISVNKYKTGVISNNLFFPFGFPKVHNSKNKTFEFELVSLNGNKSNSVEIDNGWFTFAAGYQIPKAEILKVGITPFLFIFKKVVTSFENIYFK